MKSVHYSSLSQAFIKRDNCYHCLQCQYMSDQLTNIRNHVEAKHGDRENKYECEDCHIVYKTLNSMRAHKSRVHTKRKKLLEGKKSKIDQRSKSTNKEQKLQEEILELELKTLPEVKYETSNDLHYNPDPLTLKVKKEDISSNEAQSINLDSIKGESKLFTCPIPDCAYSTENGFYIKKHFGHNHIHGEGPNFFKCQENDCDYSTSETYNLKRHYKGKHIRAGCCSICGLLPKSKAHLDRHFKMHETHFYCEKCKRMQLKEDFQNHDCKIQKKERSSTKASKYKEKFASYGENIDDYMEIYLDGELQKFKCKKCGCVSITKHSWYRHCQRHFGGEFSCDVCGVACKNLRSLDQHKKYKHSIEGQTICTTCGKSFPHEDFPNHECNQYICNECGKILKSKGSLESHIQRVHRINERSHICNVCGKGFTQVTALKKHVKTQHESKKEPTPCPECGVKVMKLENHMRHVHTPDDQRKYQCQHCGKGFDFTQNLDKHMMNMHLKLRPYNCRYGCDISYNDKSNRNHHERKRHGKLFISVEEEQIKAKMDFENSRLAEEITR